MPDRFAYLNRISLLHKEYFDIYIKIKNKIHYDYPSKRSIESTVRRKIDWNRVSRRYPSTLPVTFDTLRLLRDFNSPENILLMLASIWLSRESKRILALQFSEPLNQEELSMLNTIIRNIYELHKYFPFNKIVSESSKYANLSIKDKRIMQMESNTIYRIIRE